MMKRILSIVIVIFLLMTLCYVPAYATNSDEDTSAISAFLNEATSSGFAYVFEGNDQVFDGTRYVQGTTEDINRLKASTQGTLLVRYMTLGNTNQIIFSTGGSTDVNSCGTILANAVSSVNQQRIQFPGGMQANLSGTQANGGWHTFIYSVDASDLSNTTGKTVTSFDGSTSTQYPNYASWYNYDSNINNITYMSIGNTASSMSGASGFVGRIAAVAFVPRALTQQEAAVLTAEEWQETPQLIYSGQNIQIASSAQALTLNSDVSGQIAALNEITIIAKYKNTNTGIGSLFSVSDPNEEISHFHLYQNNDILGFEYRNDDEPFYSTTCNVYPREWNTVAFTASKTNGYRLFANGSLGAVLAVTGSDYQFLSETITWTNCSIGKTVRSNEVVGYPFTGEIAYIEIYSGALSDETLITRTAETEREDSFVFYNGDNTGSTHFRIPFLWTTTNGTLLAGVDANFGSGGDSAENIDIAIRLKPNASQYDAMEGWQNATVPDVMHMLDYADENGYRQKSASFIDATIVQDTLNTGRILLLADAWTWNGGLYQHLSDENGDTEMRDVARGDGFCTIGGKKYLLLSSQNIKGDANNQTGNINNNTDRSKFDYVADVYGEKDENGQYAIYHLNGTPNSYPTLLSSVNDSNLSLGEKSEYTLTADYELCKDGVLLTVTQKTADEQPTGVIVPMKIFYEDSVLQMYNTSYIMQFYSDDNGVTWHTDKIISGMVKRLNSRYYILGPGRGIQIQRGTYAGRLIIPVYYEGSPNCEIIYSDNCGATWNRGDSVSSILGLSEATPVEMPDGSIKIFIRNTSILGGTVIEATSTDGGQTWKDVKCTFDNNSAGINCQMSAIVLSQTVVSKEDGLSYPALLLSCANTRSRENGRIYVGLIKTDGTYSDGSTKYSIDWEYQYDVTPSGTLYAYSCLAELSDGRIALLYESSDNDSWDDGLQKTYYREFELNTLLN